MVPHPRPIVLTLVDPAEPAACAVAAGQTLKLGKVRGDGARAYLTLAGGLQCQPYLGSRSTFTLGQFGGHGGRAIRTGDVLHVGSPYATRPETTPMNSTRM